MLHTFPAVNPISEIGAPKLRTLSTHSNAPWNVSVVAVMDVTVVAAVVVVAGDCCDVPADVAIEPHDSKPLPGDQMAAIATLMRNAVAAHDCVPRSSSKTINSDVARHSDTRTSASACPPCSRTIALRISALLPDPEQPMSRILLLSEPERV